GLPVAGMGFDEPSATAEDAGRLAVSIALDTARLAVGDLKVFINAAELERQRIDGRIRTSAEVNRVVGRSLVEFGARGEALIAQAGDEDLGEDDPVARFGGVRARFDESQHVGNR